MNLKSRPSNRSLLTLVLGVLAIQPGLEARAALDLDSVYKAARQKTETLPIQDARVRKTEATVDRVRGQLLPKLNLNASHTRQDSNTGTGTTSSLLNRNRETSTIGLGLSQPIFDGSLFSGLNAVREDRSAQELSREAVAINLYAEVARNFYTVQGAEREVENLRTIMRLAKDRIEALRKRTKIGRSRTSEVLTSQSQLDVLEAQLRVAEGDLDVARDNFAFYTGLPRNTELSGEVKMPKVSEKVDDYLRRAQQRPDIRALKAAWEAAQSRVGVAKSGHLPTAALTGNYYLLRKGSSEGIDWDAALTLSLPLFAGGSTMAAVRESSELAAEAELNYAQKMRSAEAEIRGLHSRMTSSVENVKTLEKAVESSERSYREQNREYGFSLVTNLDVIQALNQFQDARRTLDRARYQALITFAQLQAAIAEFPKE